MITRHKLLFLLLFSLTLTLFRPRPAAAHPLGNFSVNRYSRLELTPDQINLLYILDMAEIPTFQEKQQIDADGDGVINAGEFNQLLQQLSPALLSNLDLTVNGQTLPL
ncbi:MAG: EF-hand domain-containing protein, partial [Chloroflexota bacterium]